jgi:hypothetical protein
MFLRPNTGALLLLAQRDGREDLSVQSRKGEKQEEKKVKERMKTHLAQRDGREDLCRARKGNSRMNYKRGEVTSE